MPIGTLRRYGDSCGYGFIREDGGQDTFVHVSKLREADIEFPRAGMRLEFQIAKKNGAKTQATRIRLINYDSN